MPSSRNAIERRYDMNVLRSAREWIARSPRNQTIVFFLFALLLLAIGLGLRDPWPSDEPRFALVARQMLFSGDWLFPHRGIELYSDKPPLFMWLQAVAYWITHGWRGWFLLPSLLSAVGTLGLTYDLEGGFGIIAPACTRRLRCCSRSSSCTR